MPYMLQYILLTVLKAFMVKNLKSIVIDPTDMLTFPVNIFERKKANGANCEFRTYQLSLDRVLKQGYS